MTTHCTTKLDSFRTLLNQAESIQSDLSTLDSAIRQRDAIKARMSECQEENEARNLIGELAAAEETVTVKMIRQPRMQSELCDLLTETEKACNAANTEASRLLAQVPQQAASAFRDLLLSTLAEREHTRHPQLIDHALGSLQPVAATNAQQTNLSSARRAVAMTTEPPAMRLDGLRSSLAYLDRACASQVEIAAEASRLVSACAAFRKAYSKG